MQNPKNTDIIKGEGQAIAKGRGSRKKGEQAKSRKSKRAVPEENKKRNRP